MKIINNISFLGLILLASCNQNPTKTSNSAINTKDSISGNSNKELNYSYTKNGDTIALSFVLNENKVKGDLYYHLKEKDKNEGTINGVVENNVLFADYVFQSEGQTSIREIAFKLQDNEAIEGYGPVKEENGKFVFEDKNNLNFENTIVLEKE